MDPPRWPPRGSWPVQLRLRGHTSAAYVAVEGWREASLRSCPEHGRGRCDFTRHGTYGRVRPAGTRIARYYCRTGRRTYSLLPDFLSSHLSGELDEVEALVAAVESAPSVSAALAGLRPEVELPGVARWVRRRRARVAAALLALVTLMPEALGPRPTVLALRGRLGTERALVKLRELGEVHLQKLPTPLGFAPPGRGVRSRGSARQHDVGAVPEEELPHAPQRSD